MGKVPWRYYIINEDENWRRIGVRRLFSRYLITKFTARKANGDLELWAQIMNCVLFPIQVLKYELYTKPKKCGSPSKNGFSSK